MLLWKRPSLSSEKNLSTSPICSTILSINGNDIRESATVNLGKSKATQQKSKALPKEKSALAVKHPNPTAIKDLSINESAPRLESFKLASQSLEEAIKGWAVVSQQCETAKDEHLEVKKEIECLLKELQQKIKELS